MLRYLNYFPHSFSKFQHQITYPFKWFLNSQRVKSIMQYNQYDLLNFPPQLLLKRVQRLPVLGSEDSKVLEASAMAGSEGGVGLEGPGKQHPFWSLGSSFTCFHWGVGAGRPCSGRQQDGWLAPRSCVGCDTQAKYGWGTGHGDKTK